MYRSKVWPTVDGIMLVAFVLSIVVQLNDPDPLAWIAVYTLAAAASAMALLRRGPWLFPAAVAAVSLVWAGTLAPGVVGDVPFLDMFQAFEMADVGIEESREMYGLLMIAAWMIVLAVRRARAGGEGSRETA